MILGLHHISLICSDARRTVDFYTGVLGLRRVKQTSNFDMPDSLHWYWGVEDGAPGTVVTYFERDPEREGRARQGAGQTHHYALSVEDEESLLLWRERLVDAGLHVTPVKDRIYFKSIYMHDPDGQVVELATRGPGFTVDESEAALGTGLMLPPWLEARREELESRLRPIPDPGWRAPG